MWIGNRIQAFSTTLTSNPDFKVMTQSRGLSATAEFLVFATGLKVLHSTIIKFFLPLDLPIFTNWSLFTRRQFSVLVCCHPFLAHQPSPHWKSQIAELDMHHVVFGINFQIHSVSLTDLVFVHLLIHFSSHLCHHHHSQHALLHSFTPRSKPTSSTNRSHVLYTSWTDITDHCTGPNLSWYLFF